MPDRNLPIAPLIALGERLECLAGLPAQLPADPRRQAVASIHGTVYQAWWSIDAWLRLTSADEVIYLEGAEDFDDIRPDRAIAVQVKRNVGSISLGNAKAHQALVNFWTLCGKESNRRVDFHYLTTSAIAKEQDGSFDGLSGIEAWRVAQTRPDLAADLANYLAAKLDCGTPLQAFLASAKPEIVQEQLIRRFHWLTDQPELDDVKRSVDNRIADFLDRKGRSVSLGDNVRRHLESHFWQVVLEPLSGKRCLTRGDLLQLVEAATTTLLPIATDRLPDFFGNGRPGWGLFNVLRDKARRPPEPLLSRPALTQRIEELIWHRKVVLLTGTVYKGKTTIAQLAASTLCPEAWWLSLTGQPVDQVDNVLLVLASRIESGDCPSLVVIDDLDISPTAHDVYRESLALVLYRSNATGRGVILTARGASSQSAVAHDFASVEILDVPELSASETEVLCVEHDCPQDLANLWGFLVNTDTRGHPKLVQVRLAELAARGWPRPGVSDLTTRSSAVTSTRQLARHLLSDSVPGPWAEFVYLLSECSILVQRPTAIRLAETVKGLTNAGDVLDNLTGKWIERIEEKWFRVTALLSGVATEVWSPEKRRQAHVRVHDVILAKGTLDPYEAAGLLLHAYIGQDAHRLALTGMRLQVIKNAEAEREMERQLFWLPHVALDAGQSISDDAMAGAVLRGLQFRVASTLDMDCLPSICDRWVADIERIENSEPRSLMLVMMWLSTGFSDSLKVPLRHRLDIIVGYPTLPSHLQQRFTDTAIGLPPSGSVVQAIFLVATRSVRDLASLSELLQWLDNVASDDVRQEFDAMLEWPLVQTLGAFVHGAWVAKHQETTNWEPWLELFARIDDYAKRRGSPRFGREAAKAKALILTENMARSNEALAALDQAEADFGPSAVLLEQRANVLFQANDDEAVLRIWSRLASDPAGQLALDPFACRRAGISAARLHRWHEAEHIFTAAADLVNPGLSDVTRFGLRVDAALAASFAGKQSAAIKLLADAVLALPPEAALEGDSRWDAGQRAASTVNHCIENCLWKPTEAVPRLEPGFASSPDLIAPTVDPGQAARSEITRVQVLRLAATIGAEVPGLVVELDGLARSRYAVVRWLAAEARLSLVYATGAGAGFIDTLLAFDQSFPDAAAKPLAPSWLLEPDDGPEDHVPASPERWCGLLIAGVICAGPNLLAHLQIWLDESSRWLGRGATLTEQVRLILQGARQPAELLPSSLSATESPAAFRCGAAAKLLMEVKSADETLRIQGFLASALVSDLSFARQELFNRHIARCYARPWRIHAQNRFQFFAPRISVPALLLTLDEVENGSGTLRGLLVTLANSLRQPLGEFLDRLV